MIFISQIRINSMIVSGELKLKQGDTTALIKPEHSAIMRDQTMRKA